MKSRILGYTKDKKIAKVRFEDGDFQITRNINCVFVDGLFSKTKTDEIIAAQLINVRNKREIGII